MSDRKRKEKQQTTLPVSTISTPGHETTTTSTGRSGSLSLTDDQPPASQSVMATSEPRVESNDALETILSQLTRINDRIDKLEAQPIVSDNEEYFEPSQKRVRFDLNATTSQKASTDNSASVESQIDDILKDGHENEGIIQQNTDLLGEITQDFELGDISGPEVAAKLASILKDMFGKKLGDDKMKDTMMKYKIPGNVEMVTPMVNREIWDIISAETKSRDIRMQKIQTRVNKACLPIISVLDTFLQVKAGAELSNSDANDCMKKLFDSIALLSNGLQEINQRRRDLIRPDLNVQYRKLCYNTTVTTELFGDDLSKSIKDIQDTHKIGARMAYEQNARPAYRKGGYYAQSTNAPGHGKFHRSPPAFLGKQKNYATRGGHYKKRGGGPK